MSGWSDHHCMLTLTVGTAQAADSQKSQSVASRSHAMGFQATAGACHVPLQYTSIRHSASLGACHCKFAAWHITDSLFDVAFFGVVT